MFSKLVKWLTISAIFSGVVLSLAGQWADPWLWAYVAAWALFFLIAIVSTDDDLARERRKPGGPTADRVPLAAIRLLAIAHLIVGALDAGRWHIALVAPWLRAASLAATFPSFLLVVYALRTNRFFSAAVRIQNDRGHRVVDRGPYSVIRHPGYAGMILGIPLSGLALGSWMAFAIAIAYSLVILRRVLFEDAFLKSNLSGYTDYSDRVRYRLMPGVW